MKIWTGMLLCLVASSASAAPLPVCDGDPRVKQPVACLYDGDTGIERGTRWQLMNVDAPEIDPSDARCRDEQVMGIRARDRLRGMLSRGYTIVYQGKADAQGRLLAKITLADGRDVASELMSQGIVQALPHTQQSPWCDR